MNKKEILKTAEFARKCFEDDFSGHDWWHTYRVWKLSKNMALKENVDLFLIEMAALLHDVSDEKLNNGNASLGKKKVIDWLTSLELNKKTINKIWEIIESVSFKGANIETKPCTLEAMIVQDSDRLDALGAVGIARTFAYGGSKDREIYNPEIQPINHRNYEEYKNSKGTSINHFYEKLLLLKNRLNTKTAKQIAQKRHDYIEEFLKEFLAEWEGIK